VISRVTLLRPGSSVRVYGESLVLSRMGRSVTVAGSPHLPRAWEAVKHRFFAADSMSATGEETSDAVPDRHVADFTRLLSREGLTVDFPVGSVDQIVAAIAPGKTWISPCDVIWQLAGNAAAIAIARDALGRWQTCSSPLTVVDTSASTTDPVLSILLLKRDNPTVVAGTVIMADGTGLTVVDIMDRSLLQAWRAQVPAVDAPGGDTPRLNLAVAVGIAMHRAQQQLARSGRQGSWHRVAEGRAQLRHLPELCPQPRPAALPLVDQRGTADGNGEIIDALNGSLDTDLGWWSEPHPGALVQLPVALLASHIGTGDNEHLAVGTASTHDNAWVATALAVATHAIHSFDKAAIPFAGVGSLGALADLLRRVACSDDRAPMWSSPSAEDDCHGSSRTLALMVPKAVVQCQFRDLGWATVARVRVVTSDNTESTARGVAVTPEKALNEAMRATVAEVQLAAVTHSPPGGRSLVSAPGQPEALVTAYVHYAQPDIDADELVLRCGEGEAEGLNELTAMIESTAGLRITHLSLGSAWNAASISVGLAHPTTTEVGVL
jgi:hypothetical protein